MRKMFLALVVLAIPAAAQAQSSSSMKSAAKAATAKPHLSAADRLLARVAGVWAGKSMVGKKDSTITTFIVIATGTRSGWTTIFPNREPLDTRVIAVGGDSIVTEVGPYKSITRPDQSVTTTLTGHYHGSNMRGTFSAKFGDGGSLTGKIQAKRKK